MYKLDIYLVLLYLTQPFICTSKFAAHLESLVNLAPVSRC